jgi:uncharacterized protein (UPF0333 family)
MMKNHFKLSLLGLIMALCTFFQGVSFADETTAATTAASEQGSSVQASSSTAEDSLPVFKSVAAADKKVKAQSGTWLWMRMLGSLALVVILVVGGGYFFKKTSYDK